MTPTVQILTPSSPEYEDMLLKVHVLARQVFEPEMPADARQDSIQLQLDHWRTRLSDPAAAILYTMAEDHVSAFFLVHPRPICPGSNTIPYHIYLAGVHPSAQGQGLFLLLLDATKVQAWQKGFRVLTISTVPSVFKRMFSLLNKEGSGWQIYEFKDGEDGRRKVVFKMDICFDDTWICDDTYPGS